MVTPITRYIHMLTLNTRASMFLELLTLLFAFHLFSVNRTFSFFNSIMSVFEQLRPFVGLCQACGMIPYTIENNLITKQFSRFTFSLKHRTTWWFTCILAFQFVSICLVSYYTANGPENISTDRSLPITVNVLYTVYSCGTFIQLLLSRWTVMRYRRLQVVVEAVQEVEKLFGEEFIAQHKSSLTTRFFIGFILILTLVSS